MAAKFLSSSRYKLENTDRDEKNSMVAIRKPIPSGRYLAYTARQGDTFDLLAVRTLGDPGKWWMIADINPHVFFPGPIEPGTQIRIPKL